MRVMEGPMAGDMRLHSRREALGLFAAACAPVVAARESDGAAMWVWRDRLGSPDAGLAVFARRRSVRLLNVYVPPETAEALLTGRGVAVECVAALRASGLRLAAMAGEPDWARGPENLPEHAALVARLGARRDLFDGVHFDVEANALPDWRDQWNRRGLARGLAKFYAVLRAAAPGVAVDAAVNAAYAVTALDPSKSMLDGVLESAGSVSVMAYRTGVERAKSMARPSAAAVARARRKFMVGVLVGPDPEEAGASWSGTSVPLFEASMRTLDSAFRFPPFDAAYAGLVYHDYDGMAAMYARESWNDGNAAATDSTKVSPVR
jgi:hypothetical protein